MKKIIFALLFCVGFLTTQLSNAQEITLPSFAADVDKSEWGFDGPGDTFTMNYKLFNKSYARGLWYGAAGYAAGMYLSDNRTVWGIVGSLVAVNIPILLDKDYDKEELWIGHNLGALTISVGATFTIEMSRKGKANWSLHHTLQHP